MPTAIARRRAKRPPVEVDYGENAAVVKELKAELSSHRRRRLSMSLTLAKRQAIALKAFVELGTETGACQLLGLSRSAWHKWTARYEKFREAADQAFQTVGDLLEQEAIRRAYDGSDLLLIYLLNGYKPEKFRERQETNINVNSDAIRKFFERAASQPLGPPALTHDISGLVVEAD